MKSNCILNYGAGLFVKEEVINRTAEKVIEAIKNELPEEAHCESVVKSVLNRANDIVGRKHLEL